MGRTCRRAPRHERRLPWFSTMGSLIAERHDSTYDARSPDRHGAVAGNLQWKTPRRWLRGVFLFGGGEYSRFRQASHLPTSHFSLGFRLVLYRHSWPASYLVCSYKEIQECQSVESSKASASFLSRNMLKLTFSLCILLLVAWSSGYCIDLFGRTAIADVRLHATASTVMQADDPAVRELPAGSRCRLIRVETKNFAAFRVKCGSLDGWTDETEAFDPPLDIGFLGR